GDFQSLGVGDAAPVYDSLRDSKPLRNRRELLASAVYDCHSDSHLLAQRYFFGERVQFFLILCYFPGQLHDEALVLEALNIWQRFPQKIEPFTYIYHLKTLKMTDRGRNVAASRIARIRRERSVFTSLSLKGNCPPERRYSKLRPGPQELPA